MFLKFLGLIIVTASSTLIGFMLCQKFEYRLKDLRNLRLSLSILEREISFLMNSVADALINASKIGGNVSRIFSECSQILNQKEGYCVKEAWEKSINENFKYTYLLNEDKEILISLGQNLGLYDIDNHTQSINYICSQLEIQENNIKEIIDKKIKMYKSLSLLAGLAISIILI